MESGGNVSSETMEFAATSSLSSSGVSSNNIKNDIKISEDGVAKLSFGFLDDLQGDSSLEPGEVKSPPRGVSPAPTREPTPPSSTITVPSSKALAREKWTKALKTVSRMETEACQEKVRLILELDAQRRKEEKLEMQKRRRIEEESQGEREKKKSKEDRKKLKELKRAQRAAKKALRDIDKDDDGLEKSIEKTIRQTQSDDSEGLCSSAEDENPEDMQKYVEKVPSIVSVVNTMVTTPRFPSHMVHPSSHQPHLLPDKHMGYRSMNPFMRAPKVDFSHGRPPRGRGGLRGRMPFSGFRPPFFSCPNLGNFRPNIGGLMSQHHAPQHRPNHTQPPNRGHSPILPPLKSLHFTKCKPSISYSFKMDKQFGNQLPHLEVKHNLDSTKKFHFDTSGGGGGGGKDIRTKEDDENETSFCQDSLRKSKVSKEKLKKSPTSKHAKKSKNNSAKHLRETTSSMVSKKKKNKKSSKRKIDKTRKSYDSRKSSDEASNATHEEISEKEEYIPDAEEIRNKVQNMKVEKDEKITTLKTDDIALKVKPLIMIKQEPVDNEEENTEIEEQQNDSKNSFDMFADSPPRTRTTGASKPMPSENVGSTKSRNSIVPSSTPPLPVKEENTVQNPPILKNAIEIQKRIDKILQQDDIKFEAIEAAKEMLMLKTLKHQNAKDKQNNSTNIGNSEDKNKNDEKVSKDVSTPKRTTSKDEMSIKEKPNAYKERRKLSQTEKEKQSDQHRDPSKNRSTSKFGDEKDRRDRKYEYEEKSSSINKDKRDEKDHYTSELSRDKSSNRNRSYHERDKSYRDSISSTSRNAFNRSLSKDRKIESHKRSRDNSRETNADRRLSDKRKRSDSFGKTVSKTRRLESGIESKSLSKSKSCDRRKESISPPHTKTKDKLVKSSTSYSEKETEKGNKKKEPNNKSDAVQPEISGSKERKTIKKNKETKKSEHTQLKKPLSFSQDEFLSPKETKKSEHTQLKKPLSFSQDEFLSPKEDEESTDFPLFDDSQDSYPTKSQSYKDDSPDTDDYMDNWENDDEDADAEIDMFSNVHGESSTPLRVCPNAIKEEESFVSRFVNPSPPSEVIKKENNSNSESALEPEVPTTPPLSLLKVNHENTIADEKEKIKQLTGMQELYDQFIKSVEATGVEIKTNRNEQNVQKAMEPTITGNMTLEMTKDPLSTSSTSTSSTSSSSSSSSEYNSSSSSSSSGTTSDDSNADDNFTKSKKNSTRTTKIEHHGIETQNNSHLAATENISKMEISTVTTEMTDNIVEREPCTPSPTPLQRLLIVPQTPPTPVSLTKSPKTAVARDFKKLKNLEANLSRIQLMRANYDSNDEISEELHKMENLFLQEKKLILQKYSKSSDQAATSETENFVQTLPLASHDMEGQFSLPPRTPPAKPPVDETNKIFDTNRESIKLTISQLKLPTKPAIFQAAITEDLETKSTDDNEEIDFTEKLVKPAKEVAIVKPMMETKETQESRSKGSQSHRRSPGYTGSRDRTRSPTKSKDRSRRSSSKSRLSPQRRSGRGRSLSVSPPRRNVRHASPHRRGISSRFRMSSRRSRSRSSSRSQASGRRGKEGSPLRSRKGSNQMHYKKIPRNRASRSRSPRSPQRPRSPRSPPPRRRSYSSDRYSPLPFKPPSPPMRRSHSPLESPHSPTRRSRSPRSPRRPRSPRSSRSPRSADPTPHSTHFDDHRRRRENRFDRHTSPRHNQYYPPDSHSAVVAGSANSSYYYDMSPSRISLDARIDIVLNGPGGHETPPVRYDDYNNYAQYGGTAYMSIAPQSMNDPNGASAGYYPNPCVSMIPPPAPQSHHHHMSLPPPEHMQGHVPPMPPHLHTTHPSSTYSNIPTINSGGLSQAQAHFNNQFYFSNFQMGQHLNTNPVLKELTKVSSVAVQKGNVLEIVPSHVVNTSSSVTAAVSKNLATTVSSTQSTIVVSEETTKKTLKVSLSSWKEEVNSRHGKSAVIRLTRESNNNMQRSILKRPDLPPKALKIEKKKVYFEDGIYPSRDSDDEDRNFVVEKTRRKILRLRKKHGIDMTATLREAMGELHAKRKLKINPALEKLPPPPPPATVPPAYLEQPKYLKPPTPVPWAFFHFDNLVSSMYVSLTEKGIPPRLLDPKCVPPPPGPPPPNFMSQQSPNMNSPTSVGCKKDLAAMSTFNRAGGRGDISNMNSPRMMADPRRASPNWCKNFQHCPGSPGPMQMHSPAPMRNFSPAMGFVGMRINHFTRLPPSPLTRDNAPPPFFPPNMPATPLRHIFNVPPPCMPADNRPIMPQYPTAQKPHPPGFVNMQQRPSNPRYFMGSPSMHYPPPPLSTYKDNYMQNRPGVMSPQIMIAPYHVKKDC